MLKKCLSVLLCLILAFSAFATTVAAVQVQGEISDLPLVMVAGYSSPELVMTDEDGNKTQVWGLNMDSVLSRVLNRIVDIGKGLVMTLDGNAQYLGKVVGEELEQELEYMKLNPDGTSKYNVTVANPGTMEKNMNRNKECVDFESQSHVFRQGYDRRFSCEADYGVFHPYADRQHCPAAL